MKKETKEMLGLVLILTAVLMGVLIAYISNSNAGFCHSFIQLMVGLSLNQFSFFENKKEKND
jgi:hypothetical protein